MLVYFAICILFNFGCAQVLQDPLLALLQPSPLPNNLVGIPGPVFVESSQLHGALLGVPLVGIPATIDAVVKSDPYNPYAAAIQSTPAIKHIPVQAKKRLLLLDEDAKKGQTSPANNRQELEDELRPMQNDKFLLERSHNDFPSSQMQNNQFNQLLNNEIVKKALQNDMSNLINNQLATQSQAVQNAIINEQKRNLSLKEHLLNQRNSAQNDQLIRNQLLNDQLARTQALNDQLLNRGQTARLINDQILSNAVQNDINNQLTQNHLANDHLLNRARFVRDQTQIGSNQNQVQSALYQALSNQATNSLNFGPANQQHNAHNGLNQIYLNQVPNGLNQVYGNQLPNSMNQIYGNQVSNGLNQFLENQLSNGGLSQSYGNQIQNGLNPGYGNQPQIVFHPSIHLQDETSPNDDADTKENGKNSPNDEIKLDDEVTLQDEVNSASNSLEALEEKMRSKKGYKTDH